MPAVLPYARSSATGRTVHISSVPRGLDCNCVCQYCEQPLVAKKGAVKEHHFAHYRENSGCSLESWLHATAKQMLAERINAGRGIPVSWICHCKQTHSATFGIGHTATPESFIPGLNIKPDITVSCHGAVASYIEVLVTHQPDYPIDTAGAPVAVLPIKEPADLDNLYSGTVRFSDWYGIPCSDPICSDCAQRESAGCIYCPYCHKHTGPDDCLDRRIKLQAWNLLAPMRRPKRPVKPIQDWNVDSQGHNMWGRVKRTVQRNARVLMERGFAQSRKKPWLFYYRVPGGTIFAQLSSTDVIPIWECQEPMIFESYSQPPLDVSDALLRDAIRRVTLYVLNQTEAGARVSFYESDDYDIRAPLQAHRYLYGDDDYQSSWSISPPPEPNCSGVLSGALRMHGYDNSLL